LKEYQVEVNPYYYKQVFIENIVFRFFSNNIEAIQSFNDNQVDSLSVLPLANKDDLLSRDSIEIFNLKKSQIIGLFFNLDKDFLQSAKVRQALAQAINRQALVDQVYSGTYQVAYGPILNTSFVYNPEIESINIYNPEAAKESLKESDLKIQITAIDINGNRLVAEFIKNYWQDVGIEVEINLISLEEAANVIKNRDFDVILYGQALGGDPDVFAFWHSSQADSKGLNISNYKNDEVDKLLIEARGAKNETEVMEKYKLFQNNITNDVPAIFLYSPSYTYVQNKKIKGFLGDSIISPADRFGQINDWYIKTKKIRAR
jgi:peptide/nickel transport system substrate-binding protein